jgi:hypothetical protein
MPLGFCSALTLGIRLRGCRSDNVDADKLANQAIDKGSFRNLLMYDY